MNVSLFPYDEVRPYQDLLIERIDYAVKNKTNLIAHAPTGLGKTSAALAATLSNEINSSKTIFFLTSMHTQHNLALKTIRDIKKKHGVKVISVDIIGKKHLCLQPGVDKLSNGEFIEFCKSLRKEGKCMYYNNLKNKDQPSFNTKKAVEEIQSKSPLTTDEALSISEENEVCPYEISLIVGKNSKVIVTDYFYLFNPKIRDSFLAKLNKNIEDSILIIDEAHNLPDRVKELATQKLSNIALKRALSEINTLRDPDLHELIQKLIEAFDYYAQNIQKESYVKSDEIVETVISVMSYDKAIEKLNDRADEIREEKKQSYLGAVASLLEVWREDKEGFIRIFEKQQGFREEIQTLHYKCLDPGVVTSEIINTAHSTILMSGTLSHTHMYKEILGFLDAEEINLKSPFPTKNRLNIIIPKTSTKYTQRSEYTYQEMGKIISEIVNEVPGNSAVFLPSYSLRDSVYKYMKQCEKTIFLETQGQSKQEKEELLENFKQYKKSGAVLLGISSGSFAEGVDLPGDLLKCVIVVGLPLQVPDLETKAIIKYYDYKFKKGWDYGYVYPAFNRTLQSAGRCIRTENDRGVIVFLDERYAWPNYKECFPESWDLKVTRLYKNLIKDFFNEKS